MKTVVLGDPPEVLDSLIQTRKRLGLDTHDEVWNGEYHMAPAATFDHGRVQGKLFVLLDPVAEARGLVAGLEFNLGVSTNFRVPDLGVFRVRPSGAWMDTAAIVVEVRSPDDETYDKFGFYFDSGVDELLIVDLVTQNIAWHTRGETGYVEAEQSALLGLHVDEVRAAIDW